jgi:mannose-6-phosphate isomerase-like protein (cupin superfamily)
VEEFAVSRIIASLGLSCLVSVACIGQASSAETDALVGTWVLDAAKSRTTEPLPMHETRTYHLTDLGTVNVVVEGEDAYGADYAYAASGELDGRVWPVAGRDVGARILGDTISWQRIDPNTIEMDIKKKGAAFNTTRHSVSGDGMTLTISENGVDDENRPVHDTRVYERERASATNIPSTDIQALARTLQTMPGGDQLLRVVPINGDEYNVGVAVVHREKAAPGAVQASLEHNEITEVYYVLSGSAMMTTGGALENGKPQPSVTPVVGPSLTGNKVTGGVSRKVGPGDVVIVPPNTPHGFSEVYEDMIYVVVRMDPHKVLPVK